MGIYVFLFLGARADRLLTADPADPRFRERIRRGWETEIQNHAAKIDEYRNRWQMEADTHAKRLEEYQSQEKQAAAKIDEYRNRWQMEAASHAQKLEEYRTQEKQALERLREYEERLEREKREREMLGLYWADVEPMELCLGNGLRKYTARLENLIPSIDGVAACKTTPVIINGVTYPSPLECQKKVRYLPYTSSSANLAK